MSNGRGKKRDQPLGFTIIEVMIVLAIAALILLIVLLAVPALQRNSRNTSIKNDASAIVAAVGEFASNNEGAAPTSVSGSETGTITLSGVAGSTKAVANIQKETKVIKINLVPPDLVTQLATGYIVMRFGYDCESTSNTKPNAVAVYYIIETSGPNTLRCVDA